MFDPARAIFSVTEVDSKWRIGTAVAISEDLMVTCEHVVRDAVKDNKGVTLYHYPAFEGETVSEGKKSAKGEIIATDKKLDLALLRSSGRLPCFLKLEDKEKLDDSEPLRIWSWPGWTAWEKAVVDVLDAIEEGKKLGVIR